MSGASSTWTSWCRWAWNQDPRHKDTDSSRENNCDRFFWACTDANWNVLGLVNVKGRLIERYEYTPYGQRIVFSHSYILSDVNQDGGRPATTSTWTAGTWRWGT